jgi:hypothetical protein
MESFYCYTLFAAYAALGVRVTLQELSSDW